MTVTTEGVTAPTTLREARGTVAGDGLDLAWGLWPGSGPTIVALHGITASYLNFVGVAERLAGRRPLLAFDLRGRGDTDATDGPFGMAQHGADVAAAMAAFGLGPSIVVGHSMGAFVAVALAAARPDLVEGLVLIDGGFPLEAPPGIEPADMLDVALAPQMQRLRTTFPTVEAYLDYWRALPHFAGDRWNSWVESYLRYDLGEVEGGFRPKAGEAAVRADFLDSLDGDRLRSRLASLTVPVLLLRATEGFAPGDPPLLPDHVVTREAAAVRSFQDHVVPDTTHYSIALGQAGATDVAAAIVDFAKGCGR